MATITFHKRIGAATVQHMFETLVLLCVPRHILQTTVVMFSNARGMHEYWNTYINICTYSSPCQVMLMKNCSQVGNTRK